MNLWNLKVKNNATVASISTDIPEKYLARLQELGLNQGNEVMCIRKSPFSGPKSFHIGDGVFSLDQEIAQYINITLPASKL